MNQNDDLSISRLARLAGVNVETVRFYERQRLIPEPPRESGGRRCYRRETIELLLLIRRMKGLGFSLAEIRSCFRCSPVRIDGLIAMRSCAMRQSPKSTQKWKPCAR